jgi:hypothetical protein
MRLVEAKELAQEPRPMPDRALPLRPIEGLAQVQKSRSACGEAEAEEEWGR